MYMRRSPPSYRPAPPPPPPAKTAISNVPPDLVPTLAMLRHQQLPTGWLAAPVGLYTMAFMYRLALPHLRRLSQRRRQSLKVAVGASARFCAAVVK